MITDKELGQLEMFKLDEDGHYSDWEDWAIVPIDKSRQIWDFCAMSCIDGKTEPIFRTTHEMTIEEFGELFYHVTCEELF